MTRGLSEEALMQMLRYAIAAGAAMFVASATAESQIPRRTTLPASSQAVPAGMCRIWINGVSDNRQPSPTDCATARRNLPANARIIYGQGTQVYGNSGQYDPRRDPRSRQYDPRLDPRNNGRYDGDYNRRIAKTRADYLRKQQREREQYARKLQREREKAWKQAHKEHGRDQDGDHHDPRDNHQRVSRARFP
jgi:hypothetical protein